MRTRLLKAARDIIAAEGLGAVRARDLADRAGCAIGSVYNVFADMDDLILQVNSGTMRELGQALAPAGRKADPASRLEALALTYAGFARENYRLWDALFEHRMSDGGPSPDWFLEGHTSLLELLAQPIGELQPGLTEEERRLRARTCFAAVHGIVSIALQGRFLGLPPDTLDSELAVFVRQITRSMEADVAGAAT